MSRAARYPLAMPIRYRPAGAVEWRIAMTANVSRTGGDTAGVCLSKGLGAPIAVDTRVEMVLGLTDGELRAADVLCVGRIVRHGQAHPGRLALAVTIDQFAFAALRAAQHGELK